MTIELDLNLIKQYWLCGYLVIAFIVTLFSARKMAQKDFMIQEMGGAVGFFFAMFFGSMIGLVWPALIFYPFVMPKDRK